MNLLEDSTIAKKKFMEAVATLFGYFYEVI